jgi:hypothetical protein
VSGPRIVVGVDDSYAAHEALRWAASYAHSVDGRVRVIRVTPDGSTDALARASKRADLVVVGSVEHECSEQASCPVVVYRAHVHAVA